MKELHEYTPDLTSKLREELGRSNEDGLTLLARMTRHACHLERKLKMAREELSDFLYVMKPLESSEFKTPFVNARHTLAETEPKTFDSF
jgi:hypothetical protein